MTYDLKWVDHAARALEFYEQYAPAGEEQESVRPTPVPLPVELADQRTPRLGFRHDVVLDGLFQHQYLQSLGAPGSMFSFRNQHHLQRLLGFAQNEVSESRAFTSRPQWAFSSGSCPTS